MTMGLDFISNDAGDNTPRSSEASWNLQPDVSGLTTNSSIGNSAGRYFPAPGTAEKNLPALELNGKSEPEDIAEISGNGVPGSDTGISGNASLSSAAEGTGGARSSGRAQSGSSNEPSFLDKYLVKSPTAPEELGLNAGGDLIAGGMAIQALSKFGGAKFLTPAGLGMMAAGLIGEHGFDRSVTAGDRSMILGGALLSIGRVASLSDKLPGPLKYAGLAAGVLGFATGTRGAVTRISELARHSGNEHEKRQVQNEDLATADFNLDAEKPRS